MSRKDGRYSYSVEQGRTQPAMVAASQLLAQLIPVATNCDKLQPELQRVLETVGPENYGYATARLFAVGAHCDRQRRPAYAQM